MERNLFGSADKPPEEEVAEVQDIEALEPTSLKVALLGTVTGSRRNAFAVIEETKKRKQGLYKVGDTIENAVIKMILRGKVVLTVGDEDEILTMEEGPPQVPGRERVAPRPARSGPSRRERAAPRRPVSRAAARESTVRVERTDVEGAVTDINKLLSQVRVRPHFRDGKPDGLALSRIEEDSLFAKLGLQNGDIVQAIDDKSIRSPDDVLALYKKLRSGSQVAIQIDRRGRRETINYTFE
jgi:general secretion pathway protein C